MPVPDYQSLMLPVLKALADRAETAISEVRDRVAAAEELTPNDLREMMPGGHQTVFTRWTGRALRLLGYANLVQRVRRGVYRATGEGLQLLAKAPARIDRDVLRAYPSFMEWEQKRKTANTRRTTEGNPNFFLTADAQPDLEWGLEWPKEKRAGAPLSTDESADTLKGAVRHTAPELRDPLETEILERVRKVAPAFFEQVVLDLLIAMGYGGGDAAMGRVTGRSGDGGIDGIIKEDALGLNQVYFQAKRYADGNSVGESDVRNLAGALDAAGANTGVFVTTTIFTAAARNYVERSPKRIGLIDGKELARLMVAHDIGVRRREIRQIDKDYFEPDAS